jgi:PAB-dependent poly(A)-specific ribonuclease subunit 2
LLAAGLGLLENPVDDQISLIRLIETFNRFILEQLHKESISNKSAQSQVPIIDQLFGSTSLSHSKCLSCKHMTARETRSFQYDLSVNEASKSSNESFISLLRSSIARESHTKAWCDKCARYQLTEQKRYLATLPNLLCINSAAATSKAVLYILLLFIRNKILGYGLLEIKIWYVTYLCKLTITFRKQRKFVAPIKVFQID